MPATIPENSTRGSSARMRITSCLGRKFLITETTRTLNGSGLVPWNTVSAVPTMPGLTSDSGRIAGGGPPDTTARKRRASGSGEGLADAWDALATEIARTISVGNSRATTRRTELERRGHGRGCQPQSPFFLVLTPYLCRPIIADLFELTSSLHLRRRPQENAR